MRFSTGIAIALSLVVLYRPVHSRTWSVLEDGTGDAPTIQAGIDSAAAGDTVKVGTGLFTDHFRPPGTDTIPCVAYMKSDIALIGSGKGVTTLAPGYGRGIYCVGVTGASIESLTVAFSFTYFTPSGIYCDAGSAPTIRHCEVKRSNSGGIWIRDNSNPTLIHCDIRENMAKVGGGLP